MVETNPRGEQILIEDQFKFNDLAFDTIVEKLRYLEVSGKTI